MEKRKILLFALIAILVVALGIGVAAYVSRGDSEMVIPETNTEKEEVKEEKEEKKEESKIKIFDLNSDDRPIAYMIDNNKNAQPQSNINKAFVVYEIIVEGNETRLMAIFKDQDEGTVGPIRSARHYFLDYAAEYDAIYAHLGLSPQAGEAMQQQGTDNINGQLYDDGKARHSQSMYWRDKSRKAPHNAYTSIETIRYVASTLGYEDTTKKGTPFNYSAEEVVLDADNAIDANKVVIPYASSHKVSYTYDEETGRYTRYSKGNKQKDNLTGEDATTKNLIITFAENYDLKDSENKGRQEVITVGTLDGYYVTNGKAIPIKCIKKSKQAQTVYQDLAGNEISINDGNTWVNVCPKDADVTFE